MDFDRLYEILPKYSTTWTVDDIQIWLNFIGLSNFVEKFRNASVDGSCLAELSQQDFKTQLGIESKILLKKIMTWIKQGIKNYDSFVSQKESLNSSKTLGGKIKSKSKNNSESKVYEERQQLISEEKYKIPKKQFNFQYVQDIKQDIDQRPSKKRQGTQMQERQKKQINELIIKQCESQLASCFSLKQHGGTIGRHSKNEIHIVDECVSRFHAQIEYQNNEYYIRDLGSSSGTFIRITEKTQLYNGIIIEMGSNQFQVNLQKLGIISLRIIEGPGADDVIQLSNKTKINVGRKTTNQIHFPEDQHLSNIHSTLYEVQGVWYVEDLGTTNGTWLRLSPESTKSQSYLLDNGTQFKLGGNMTYECQKTCMNRKTQKQRSDKCTICKVTEKNCIFLPCKHNISCLKCAQMNEISHCTVCGSSIVQLMKIFKV